LERQSAQLNFKIAGGFGAKACGQNPLGSTRKKPIEMAIFISE
jgi:hypothetical protein